MIFPHLFEKIFQKLNNKNLFRSKEVARSWKYFINERNYLWLCVVSIPIILQNGNSYLHLAAKTGQIEAFRTVLSEEDDINIKNVYGETSFHRACEKGRLNIVELLLESANLNVDINARGSREFTGFICACQGGHSNIAKLLIEKSVTLGPRPIERRLDWVFYKTEMKIWAVWAVRAVRKKKWI